MKISESLQRDIANLSDSEIGARVRKGFGGPAAVPRTLEQLAQEAIDIQNACNLRGLSTRYAEVVEELIVHVGSVAPVHAIHRLWASKLHDLAGMGLSNTERYGVAYETCKLLAKSPK